MRITNKINIYLVIEKCLQKIKCVCVCFWLVIVEHLLWLLLSEV